MTGYMFVLAMGWVSFEGVKQAQTFAIPQPLHFGLAFPISGITGMSIAYLVTIVESSGNFLALGNATKTRNHCSRHLRGRGFSRWFRISLSRHYVYHAILFILTKILA